MKKAGLFLVTALTVLAAPLPTVDEDGFQKLLAAHKGKVALYQFWATYCEPCRVEMPQLLKLADKLRPLGFELVTISADEPEQDAAAQKILKQLAITGTTYRKQAKDDDKFIDSIDSKWSGALPALFLYDKSGRKIKSFVGETDMATVEAAIRKLL
jgi:thiol-disulfide isomerase/thioredoxin